MSSAVVVSALGQEENISSFGCSTGKLLDFLNVIIRRIFF